MSTKHRRGFYIFIGFGVALYLGAELYQRKNAARALAVETVEDSVPNVAVTHPKPLDSADTVTLPGTVEAWFQAPIYAQVSGYVTAWYKDYGAVVKKGDVLAEIDTPTIRADLDQAKANVEAARAAANIADLYAKRYAAMRSTNALAEQAIAEKEADAQMKHAELAAREQSVQNLQALHKFSTIVAPYDGVVIARGINVGDYVNKDGSRSGDSGTNLFTVADIHQMRLFVSVPESMGDFLKPGLEADVVLSQFPGKHYKAKFLTVSKGFGTATRTAVTEFVLENKDHDIWPGSFASVRLLAKLDRQGLSIPSTALVFQEKGTQVAVLGKDGKVHFKNIAVSRFLDGAVEVVADGSLALTDTIIDNPSAVLLEGDAVHVVTPANGYTILDRKQG